MPDPTRDTAADWQPVPGATTVEEHDGSAWTVYVLRECPVCGAAVPRGSTEKHDEWHQGHAVRHRPEYNEEATYRG